jgi:hypothetical protein
LELLAPTPFGDAGFKNEPLGRLLKSTANTLGVRYEKPMVIDEYDMVSEDDRQNYMNMTMHLRQTKVNNLDRANWLQGVFDQALLKAGWDVNGQPVRREIVKRGLSSTRKRKSQRDSDIFPRQKKKFGQAEEEQDDKDDIFD